jgi:hypothetical protein
MVMLLKAGVSLIHMLQPLLDIVHYVVNKFLVPIWEFDKYSNMQRDQSILILRSLRFSKKQGHFVKADKQTTVTETANTVTGVASIDIKTRSSNWNQTCTIYRNCLLKGAQ